MSCFKQDEAQKNITKPPPRSSQVDRTIASRMDTSDIVSSTTHEKMMTKITKKNVIEVQLRCLRIVTRRQLWLANLTTTRKIQAACLIKSIRRNREIPGKSTMSRRLAATQSKQT
ncbi:hypothetical protein FGO68_gene15396 [Halteria grandinella]|uniref:Uncharacterized protein n=1 Tax=Halteria grandinella TaxID=5974 RepID=A0A8J8NCY9_HALGN|nr:hypothetical protein FGO68_gene15396 [Halteria grandinella]